MKRRLPVGLSRRTVLLALAGALLLTPPAASAATVVNGDFETGTLSGWNTQSTPPDGGRWLAYNAGTFASGPEEPLAPVLPPPAGAWAAITTQEGPGTRLMYQDVSLEPYWSHRLTMLVYYTTNAPELVTPSPNTLSLSSFDETPPGSPDANQQYRIDVVSPAAPLDSLAPSDVLATAFATKTGDPQAMPATAYSLDLTPFAGQTVRLRLAEVDNQGQFYAGVDAVAIQSTPPSNAFRVIGEKLNKKKGTGTVTVETPGPGELSISTARASGGKRPKKMIKQADKAVPAGGTVKLKLKPTAKGRAKLSRDGKLRSKMTFRFTPTGGLPAAQNAALILKLKPPR